MDVKGPFPKRMLKKGAFTMKHFEGDPGMSFKLYEDDPVTRQPVCAPQRDILSLNLPSRGLILTIHYQSSTMRMISGSSRAFIQFFTDQELR